MRLRLALRWGLGLLLGVIAWRLADGWLFLYPGAALLLGALAVYAVGRPATPRTRRLDRAVLLVALGGFGIIAAECFSTRNLVLAGLMVAVLGLLAVPGADE